jgi:hypothetical protein
MARVPDIKRIQKEEFNKKDQELIEQLAFPINSFMEQVKSALNGNLDFTNINQEIVTVTLAVDSSGVPKTTTKYKSNLKTNVAGHVILALVDKDAGSYPSGAPFITYTQSSNIVQILHVAGLTANVNYKLTVLSIGK